MILVRENIGFERTKTNKTLGVGAFRPLYKQEIINWLNNNVINHKQLKRESKDYEGHLFLYSEKIKKEGGSDRDLVIFKKFVKTYKDYLIYLENFNIFINGPVKEYETFFYTYYL